MAYYHNKFNQVDRIAVYQFIKFLEEKTDDKGFPYSFTFGDEFRKIRQIVAFYYSHGGRD